MIFSEHVSFLFRLWEAFFVYLSLSTCSGEHGFSPADDCIEASPPPSMREGWLLPPLPNQGRFWSFQRCSEKFPYMNINPYVLMINKITAKVNSAMKAAKKRLRQQLLKSNRKSSMLVSSDFSYSYPDIPCQRPFLKK